MEQKLDLFGNPIIEKNDLKVMFGANPFSILDVKDGLWQARKRKWISLGIKSEIGRDAQTFHMKKWADKKGEEGLLKGNKLPSDTSIFDPVLCELMYRWFCKDNGTIIDPFAGGSVRGIVANYLGYRYTGIEIRQEQVDSNREQALDILDVNNQPQWYVGDSNIILDDLIANGNQYDMMLTCPPYADLEVYSQLQGDISNMDYDDFIFGLESIIRKTCKLIKKGGMAVIVVGEVRNKKNGYYYGFVPDTIKMFQRCKDMYFYNEAILETSIASAALRAVGNMKSGKLVKVHQNVLVFKKD
jgi:DNA modification methylase